MNCHFCQKELIKGVYKDFCTNHESSIIHYYNEHTRKLHLVTFVLGEGRLLNKYLFDMYVAINTLHVFNKDGSQFVDHTCIYQGIIPYNFSPETAYKFIERISNLKVFS